MKTGKLLLALIIFSNHLFGQMSNLCGIWIAKSYQCYTVGPGGTLAFYFKDEIVLIEHVGNQTIATKVTGDDCVMAGQTTWQGSYTQNPFPVSVTLGSPGASGNTHGSGTIQVLDSSHLVSSFGGIQFRKATCDQIDSMHVNLDSLNIGCIKCKEITDPKPEKTDEVNLPNVFTPNNDGINDVFLPEIKASIKQSELTVYNRWGNLIFKTNQINEGWNGHKENENYANGVYFWVLKYTTDDSKEHILKGNITLLN
ncbi:MAG: gliding motility-associated C-terminal domain-containing protein [Bacteroidia bacterium]|nr:gliding motility-associated C-terminal domain-containing protein [Bacteroidia bacterium]MCC6768385.1 gliding motility-associated C-terminal domain-containing protein [Bacteroidia bacterium]